MAPAKSYRRTIKSLRLNVEEATKGRIWLLLPEGFRELTCGRTYPLPSKREELQRLATVPLPPGRAGAGGVYLRRAINEFKRRESRRVSAVNDIGMRQDQIARAHMKFEKSIEETKAEMAAAVAEVKAEADRQIASLDELFRLGRQGIEGQMKAHLDGKEWKGEKITAHAFRDAFRMVSQSVKGLGLPTDQGKKAREAVQEELVNSLKATNEALSMAPGTDPKVEH